MYPVSRDRKVKLRPKWDWIKLLLLLAVPALLFRMICTAAQFGGDYDPALPIETSFYVLPTYTVQTLLQIVVAYLLSLGLTPFYAYSTSKIEEHTIFAHIFFCLTTLPLVSLVSLVPAQNCLCNIGMHPLGVLNWAEWQQVIIRAILTALRVFTVLVLSLAWIVPVGVAIGRNPRLAQILQPLVQIAASVPATALFLVLLLALTQVGGGLQIGSIILMMLGTMWYLLFNVIAGAQTIPSDLFEAARVYKLSPWQRWQTVILPGIFLDVITGIITAVGGAWNASIVSEYIEFKGRVVETSLFGCNDFSSDGDREFFLAFSSYCCDVSSSSPH